MCAPDTDTHVTHTHTHTHTHTEFSAYVMFVNPSLKLYDVTRNRAGIVGGALGSALATMFLLSCTGANHGLRLTLTFPVGKGQVLKHLPQTPFQAPYSEGRAQSDSTVLSEHVL